MFPRETVQDLNAFYGDPRGVNGQASPTWERQNLVNWVPPYQMYYSDGKHTPFKHLRIHKKAVETFNAAFKEVLTKLGQEYITRRRLDITGGTYCYRLERGGSRLSVHSWGCAIDIDPAHNTFPSHWRNSSEMLDLNFATILKAHGFDWRGDDNDNDPMHFQLCRHRW